VSRSAAGLVGVLLAVSCGADDRNAERERTDCIHAAQARATAQVAREAWEEGRLGDADRVRADIEGLRDLGSARKSFLRADGTMIPWTEMTQGQRVTFSHWIDLPRIDRAIGDDKDDAVRDARERAERDCD
jgi:hypothetical protein